MSDLLILRALLFAGECVLASVALPLLAFAVTALLRRRAALRHLVWTTMFGVLAMLPLAMLLLPPRLIVQHATAPVAAPAMMDVPVIAAPVAAVPPTTLSPGDLLLPENIIILLAMLWLAGLAWQVLRMAVGSLGLMRLRRNSEAFAVAIETGCDVRLSRGEDGPSTFGILRPVVLLPRSAAGWPSARLEAVLRHEAAHVARRDTLSQGVARLVCAVYWLNPLLWLAHRALRRAAEIAADDAVLASGMTPSLYAAELVRLAAESNGIAPGIAMAQPPLVGRVQAVLAENLSRKGVSRMDIARTVSFGLAVTLLLGAARFDLAVAQGAQPAPVAPIAPVAPRALPAPRVEARPQVAPAVNWDAEVEKRVQAKAAAVKAQADLMVAQSRARAAAETDPKTKEIFRRDAEEKAAQAAVTKADADVSATMSRARQAAAEARQSDSEFQRGAMAMSETALARTQQALARQAQAQARGKADPGKQQLMQLMADSVAVARQEMAQARERAEADTRSARAQTIGPVAARSDVDSVALMAAINIVVAEARAKISAAVDDARAKTGLPPAPKPSFEVRITDGDDLPRPPVPPAPRAIPPVPLPAPLPPMPN